MHRLTIPVAAALIASGTLAQARPFTPALSCGQAVGLVRSYGAIVLGTGGPTYDRYVSDRRFCQPTEVTRAAFIPTHDTPYCFVGYTCIEPFRERLWR